MNRVTRSVLSVAAAFNVVSLPAAGNPVGLDPTRENTRNAMAPPATHAAMAPTTMPFPDLFDGIGPEMTFGTARLDTADVEALLVLASSTAVETSSVRALVCRCTRGRDPEACLTSLTLEGSPGRPLGGASDSRSYLARSSPDIEVLSISPIIWARRSSSA